MYEVYGWYVVGMVCASGVVTRTPGGTVYTPVSLWSSSTPHTLYTLVWCCVVHVDLPCIRRTHVVYSTLYILP
jgi:hypothetical protein